MLWRSFFSDFARVPWKTAMLTLRERFRADRLGLTASSLTFTTTIALVPFFTVALAVFTAFPMFSELQTGLQSWLVQSLVPESISQQVLGYMTQFAGKASRLGVVGFAALFFTAIALVLTIDRTLNAIWRVRRPRPLGQRVLVYWAVMTLGPVLLAASVSITSYAVSASRGLVGAIPGGVQFLLNVVEFTLLTAGLAALYRFVPNTPVKPSHAVIGAIFAAVGIEVAKRLLALYIALVPTYSVVYGAFATAPILLVWIYVGWLVVLCGAVVTAYLPSLLDGARRQASVHGWQFELALEILQHLHAARGTSRRGLSMRQLAQVMDVETLQLEPVLETLVQLDWVARLNELQDDVETRFVLLAEAESTALEPLMRHLLLPVSTATEKLWRSGRLSALYLKDVVGELPARAD